MRSLRSVIPAGVTSPAPSGQGTDGDAGVLGRVELRRLSDLFWDATLGRILTRGIFWLVFFFCICYRGCFPFFCLSPR